MSVSIADVARRARVSISTVSRVINGRNVVHPETRARVEAAIRELGYRPNAFARGLMLRRSGLMGLVLPDLHGDFYSEIIRGANQHARELGFGLVVSSMRPDESAPALLRAIEGQSLLDGVALMVSEVDGKLRRTLGRFDRPFVLLDADIESVPHDCVLIDQQRGAEALTRHLVQRCGVRRVIFLGGQRTNIDTMARLRGCCAVMRAAGLVEPRHDVFYLDYSYDRAYELAREHVRRWAGPRTAVFAANDEMAAGVLAAAATRGVRVPDELIVVGFDDTRVARMTRPALTTMRVPMAQMGAEAVRLLSQRVGDPTRAPQRVVLTPELVVRESCGGAGSGERSQRPRG